MKVLILAKDKPMKVLNLTKEKPMKAFPSIFQDIINQYNTFIVYTC